MRLPSINYQLVKHAEGTVLDLFEHGLSFKLMLKWQLLPPLRIFNQFLACGVDDSDVQSGSIHWSPTRLTSAQLRRLCEQLSDRGHAIRIDRERYAPSMTYGQWFSKRL